MNFISTNIEELLPYFEKLTSETQPIWGKMSAQRMVEHLTDILKVASGEVVLPLEIPEEHLPKTLQFLESDKPIPKNITVSYVPKTIELRHSEIELSVDEYIETWLDLEILFAENPTLKTNHPFYGPLSFEQWDRFQSKHLTHHFQQFGLIEPSDLDS